jgi:hypothetical protein
MSQPSKRPSFLQASEISELFLDTDMSRAAVSSDISSVEGVSANVPGLSHPQPYRQTASSHEYSSSISSSVPDEEDAVESGPGEQFQLAVTLRWTRPSCPHSSVAHTYIQGATEERRTTKCPTRMMFPDHLASFFCILQKSSLCRWWRLIATTTTTWTELTMEPLLNLTSLKSKICVFLALTIQMGHGIRGKLTDYWPTFDQVYTPLYGTMMKWDR